MVTNNDRLIAVQYLQDANDCILLAANRMESDDIVIDSVKNPIECALWDLLNTNKNIIDMIVKERFANLDDSINNQISKF